MHLIEKKIKLNVGGNLTSSCKFHFVLIALKLKLLLKADINFRLAVEISLTRKLIFPVSIRKKISFN